MIKEAGDYKLRPISSMFDDMNQMEQDGICDTIAHQLFDEWVESNLDEGTFYADYQICLMYGSPELQKQFNEFYDMKPDEEHYFEVD
jgi:hypothetical protein